jgi:hypothetical protein
VFEGGHTWLSSELAIEAIEWMEIQAMSSGMRPLDRALVDDVFNRRTKRADDLANDVARMREWQSIARDFRGFRNVSELDQRAAALSAQADVKAALDAERADARREDVMRAEVAALLEDVDTSSGVAKLQAYVNALLGQSREATDSSSRRIARRVLTSLRAVTAGTGPPELKALLEQIPTTIPR